MYCDVTSVGCDEVTWVTHGAESDSPSSSLEAASVTQPATMESIGIREGERGMRELRRGRQSREKGVEGRQEESGEKGGGWEREDRAGETNTLRRKR